MSSYYTRALIEKINQAHQDQIKNPLITEKISNVPLGISSFIIFLIALEIVYFHSFLTGGIFSHYGNTLTNLTSIEKPVILAALLVITAIALIIVTHGFLHRRTWARKFAIFFIIWASIWPIWGLLIENQVLLHTIMLVLYLLIFMYLMSSHVKHYFRAIFRHGIWTLYKKEVILKSGKTQIIHFFSKKTPKSGTPTHMPDGYEVQVSDRSNMPYLQKRGPHAFKYGKWTLYMKIVHLKSGITLPIYFFSKKKPKSGKPASLPDKYSVEINQRSHMPYLKRKGMHH